MCLHELEDTCTEYDETVTLELKKRDDTYGKDGKETSG